MGQMVPGPDQRARVHDALIELCFERGFAQVTVEVLCERAGIDRAAFDEEYADLENCFFQVYKGELERYRREATRARAGLAEWRDRVRATAHALYRFLAAGEKVRKFTVVEVRAAGERTQLLIGQEIEALFDLIDEGRQELADPESLTRATAESVGGGIFNQMYAAAGRGGPMPREEDILPQMMYAAVLPYLGPEAALEELSIPPPPVPATEARLRGSPPAARGYPSTVPAQGSDGEGKARPELGPLPGGHHGLSREQVAESQRERLLAAVAHVVAERGYQATTITEIVKNASVSSRVFYEHFASKEECFLAAFDAVLGHLQELIAAAVEPHSDWPQQVIAALRTALRFFTAEPDLARLCLVEALTATPAVAIHFREAALTAIPLHEAGRAERPDGQTLPESTEDSLLGGLITLTSRSILTGAESLQALLPDLVDFVLAPYLGPTVAKKLAAEVATAPSP